MTGSTPIDFVIGFLVSLGASTLNALGLNLLKLDHVRNAKKLDTEQRHDCGRPMWHFGLYLYIASQLIGSTIALNYLKTQWVAPLGSAALIFNFIFAKMLVGTNIERKDILGTFVVVASVIWIVVFGGINGGDDPEANLSLDSLKALYLRPLFAVYFGILNLITLTGLVFSIYASWLISNDRRRSRLYILRDLPNDTMKKLVGICMSIVGGLLASETLLLAKSGVKLFVISVSTGDNQFTDSISIFILIALLVTAILQVYCLNTSLKLHSSMVVVPTFYGTYTCMGLINSMIYMDEIGTYPAWAIVLVLIGVAFLIYGVMLLSAEKTEKPVEEQVAVTETHIRGAGDDEELGDIRTIQLPNVPATAKTYIPSDSTRGKHIRMFSEDHDDFVFDIPESTLRDSGESLTGTLLRKDDKGRIIVDSTNTGYFRRGSKAKLKGVKGVASGFRSMLNPQRYKNIDKSSPRPSTTIPMEVSAPDYDQIETTSTSYTVAPHVVENGSHVSPGLDDTLRRRNPTDAVPEQDAYRASDLHLDMLAHPLPSANTSPTPSHITGDHVIKG
ncbi:hypothetical protein K450DRAFT_247536 [Umbelopsis ramanniana AG]|uniref:Magnesium transporter n=1 Tax=Umbelopsis ramanniana AG TaxID=1314678 RepID=A0AAD5E7J0_UMBRA|nr:uncharacterized protein K450DRAFT_247536 [Umbelopsis ramanniana AG]KAI8578362.1 hypothetical protein K450DRAFT_247536 [Umbelopsis ramanniana AG]